MAKGIINVYPGRPFYTTIVYFGTADFQLPNTKSFPEAQMLLKKLFTLKTITSRFLLVRKRLNVTATSMLYTTNSHASD